MSQASSMMDISGGSLDHAIAANVGLAGLDESTIVGRAQAGEAAAFEALVAPRLERLMRLALSILQNDADASDVVQDACLRAWRELPRLREPARFEAWLWQIVINACRSALRTRRRTHVREIAVETMPAGFEFVQPGRALAEDLSAIDMVNRAFRRLDPEKRAILVLHHVEERPILEIAGLLAIPEGTVKWRLFSARQALERALKAEQR
jgi:RNA polymerase sigma-70 factor (ECF subfamily)